MNKLFEELLEAKEYELAHNLIASRAKLEYFGPFEPRVVIDGVDIAQLSPSIEKEGTTGLRGLAFRSAAALDNRLRNKKYFFDKLHEKYKVVTAGDSWCSFPFLSPTDLSESLAAHCAVYNLAVPGSDIGDLLESEALDELIWSVREFDADATFISGGGNEMIGEEFPEVLDLKESNPGVYLNLDHLAGKVESAVCCMRSLLEALLDQTDCPRIGFHSYDWPDPQGMGGWLAGPLTRAGVPKACWISTCGYIIDAYDAALRALAVELGPRAFRIDLRGVSRAAPESWADEIHLSSSGYARAAEIVFREFFQGEKQA